MLRDAGHVQNQHHVPIAKNGGAGIERTMSEQFSQRLDHDFLRIVDPVHRQTETALARLENDQVNDRRRPMRKLQRLA